MPQKAGSCEILTRQNMGPAMVIHKAEHECRLTFDVVRCYAPEKHHDGLDEREERLDQAVVLCILLAHGETKQKAGSSTM